MQTAQYRKRHNTALFFRLHREVRILEYAESIGWSLVSCEEAEKRRGFDPTVPGERCFEERAFHEDQHGSPSGLAARHAKLAAGAASTFDGFPIRNA